MDNEITSKKTTSFLSLSSKAIILCIFLIASALIATSIFKVPVTSVITFGLLLACPLLHFFMMRGDGHKH